jgi:hypothetical protein
MSDLGYRISDHAVLRWLERVHGVDIEFFRQQVLDEVERAVLAFGDQDAVGDASSFVIENNVVVTVLGPGQVMKATQWIGGWAVPRVIGRVVEAA